MEHTGLLFLFTCQPTKSSNFSRSGVNLRAHLLRKNYSRNFRSRFRFTKLLIRPNLKGSTSFSNILHSTINCSSSYNVNQMKSISLLLIMENCRPFTDDVMVVLVNKYVQQTHLLALIALKNIRIHSASFECIKWFSIIKIAFYRTANKYMCKYEFRKLNQS